MKLAQLASSGYLDPASTRPPAQADADRLRSMVQNYFDLTWRSLRRFGVPAESVDDAAQQVFLVASSKIDDIEPGRERPFLLGTALRVSREFRRASIRRGFFGEWDDELQAAPPDEQPLADHLLERKEARQLLDLALESMPEDLRAVFVLFELEGVATAEIAHALSIPEGTVASRLRRGRERFRVMARHLLSQRNRAAWSLTGANPRKGDA